MGIAEVYRKYVPIYLRYKISNYRKAGTERKLLEEIKAGRFKEEYPAEWDYLVTHNKIVSFPYAFHDEYEDMDVNVLKDKSCNMFYVMHENKRLYFPRGWVEPFVKRYYLSLVEEQDKRSPHRYFPEDDSFIEGCIFFDVGAAEGIISLSIIDRIDKAVLFEADPMWAEALNRTFADYKDKVQIISKYCSDENSERETTLDAEYGKILKDYKNTGKTPNCVIKADVEGMEMKVLSGATELLQDQHSSFLVCLYHKPEDEKVIGTYLQGYSGDTGAISKTEGYILYGVEAGEPSFRRGLIRLIKE